MNLEYLTKEEYLQAGFENKDDLDKVLNYVNTLIFSITRLTPKEMKDRDEYKEFFVKQAAIHQVNYILSIGYNTFSTGSQGKNISIGHYRETGNTGSSSSKSDFNKYSPDFLQFLKSSGFYRTTGRLGF